MSGVDVTAPVSAIVAAGTALRNARKGKYWSYDTKVGGITWIEPPISKPELCQMFPKWKWPKYTRGKVQLDDEKAATLRNRVNRPNQASTETEKLISRQGAGFGNPTQNRKVEAAAIRFVRRFYERTGFEIESVESENRGYDLIATNGTTEIHIEVKGVSGSTPEFIITTREARLAKTDNAASSIPAGFAFTRSKGGVVEKNATTVLCLRLM